MCYLNVCGCWGFTVFKHNVNRENPHFNQWCDSWVTHKSLANRFYLYTEREENEENSSNVDLGRHFRILNKRG